MIRDWIAGPPPEMVVWERVMNGVLSCARTVKDWWPALSLARKFAIVSSTVVAGGTIIIGSWVAMQVERALWHGAAFSTLIQVDGVVSPTEAYQLPGALLNEITAAQRGAWMVTGLVALLMVAVLFTVVLDGNQTIDRQATALKQRLAELTLLLDLNETLRGRLQEMSRFTAAGNEGLLRKIGSDLHDGPTQLISLALLRLDALDRPEDREAVRSALQNALAEIRAVSSGLLMPAMEDGTISRC
jgi:signal transduction histidine kinase